MGEVSLSRRGFLQQATAAVAAPSNRPNVLVIPTKASFQIDGQPTVFVKEGAGFRRQPIEVAARNTQDIVVASGVSEGDEIALVNPEILQAQR